MNANVPNIWGSHKNLADSNTEVAGKFEFARRGERKKDVIC
jgi:hypothetical protein